MFNNISPSELVFAGIATLIIYLLIIGIAYGKRLLSTWGKFFGQPVLQAASASRSAAKPWTRKDDLQPLIDKPADHPSERAGVYDPADEDVHFEMVEDEGFTTLLKEAERVVEQIQDTVNNIASFPANPEEVFTKIRAIVSEYGIFLETEYYDAINSFIAVTVQRDCELSWTEEDLRALWYAEAA